MAEIEIRAFERGCRSRSVPDIAALETERNQRRATSDWQFTARQARV